MTSIGTIPDGQDGSLTRDPSDTRTSLPTPPADANTDLPIDYPTDAPLPPQTDSNGAVITNAPTNSNGRNALLSVLVNVIVLSPSLKLTLTHTLIVSFS